MMIVSLGAVMDAAVSELSAVREIAIAAKAPDRKMLYASAMRLGMDMIGTMSNTLIFAFAGNSLIAMMILFSSGVQPNQLFSSNYMAVEMAQGICSTAAVILTVPVSAIIGALYYGSARK